MHRVLYFIVKADDVESAVSTAQNRFEDELMDRVDTTYNYCKPMESGHTVAGSDRWTDFEYEPVAAPLTDDVAQAWLTEAMDYTERHFAENFFGFVQESLNTLGDGDETERSDFMGMIEYVVSNSDKSWSEGGKELREMFSEQIKQLHLGGGMQRYYAGEMAEDNPVVAHIMDCYTYKHLAVVDSRIHAEHVEELKEEAPEDAYVVPLDSHF